MTGTSLFVGAAEGQIVRVTAPVVWSTFGTGNLDVRVNGRVAVPGTFNGTVSAVVAPGHVPLGLIHLDCTHLGERPARPRRPEGFAGPAFHPARVAS